MIRGEERSAYRQLEDSLGAFAGAGRLCARPASAGTPGRRRPTAADDGTSPAAPGRRRATA